MKTHSLIALRNSRRKYIRNEERKEMHKRYKKNEASNYHTENYLILAEAFGTPNEITEVKDILKRNEKNGYTSDEDYTWMYKNINPYYRMMMKETAA